MSTMRKQWKIILGVSGLLAAGTVVPTAITAQNANPKPTQKEKKVAAGEKEAKKLLLLMDKDQDGKVSKQEFMSFMEAEFDRLDKDKSGELDVKELTEIQVRTRSPISR
jgi:hypothetical protein